MTRKKYDEDTYEEDRQRRDGNPGSGDENTEQEKPEEDEEPYDPWVDIQLYIENELRWSGSASWVYKWFSPDTIIKLTELEPDSDSEFYIRDYLFPFESSEDVGQLLDHMWCVFEICRIEPTLIMIYTAVLELLAERTKYYYVNPTVKHRSIVNKRFTKLLH